MNIKEWIIKKFSNRSPDRIIGGNANPYMLRWFVIPRNPIFNVYLHHFLRSDDDRALHDHPWINFSVLLEGTYDEHTIEHGGINYRRTLKAGDWRFRWTGKLAHRVELTNGPCWTLFVTGPRYRKWGFHCENKWVAYQDFGDKGCNQ